jgi:hypothetical protein
LPDGKKHTEDFYDKIEFLPTTGAINTYFKISGTDMLNNTLCMDSGVFSFDKNNYDLLFPNLEDKKSNKEKYTTYILGLLAITLFSIPVLMKNLKDLADND